ncbi:MAG TPA: hypothetical protein PLH06_14305, partial [Candidatus Hydrogenedentes bacterium]|nr:hypothetical protein [Candidatus Hydrogenedentota bacterium]
NTLPAQVLNRKPDVIDAARRLGQFEGIDEPGELQIASPLRNRLAENNNTDDDNNGVANERGEYGDKIFNDVTDAEKLDQFGPERMATLATQATAQSDSRNVFYVDTPRGRLAFNKVDPNYATPPQLATTFMLAENLGPNFNYNTGADPASWFASGLRRGDASVTGYLFGSGFNPATGAYTLGSANWQTLEADPFLRALQLAVNLVDNRDRDAKASRITPRWATEDNERERISAAETLPLDLVKDFKINALGMDPANRNLDTTDPWWEQVTNGQQQRPIRYTVAGVDAIRINEVMVRPVRRVEAETNRPDPTINTSPSPLAGMPPFDVESTGGTLSTTSNFLGDRTVVNISPGQVYEISIRPSDWVLPPGRYYLMVNVTDPDGNMTVTDPGVLEYCVRYTDSTAPGMGDPSGYDSYIKQTMLNVFFPPPGSPLEAEVNQLANNLYAIIWVSVDNPEYLATPIKKQNGAGMPTGWVFLPSIPPTPFNVRNYTVIYNWISTNQGL